MKIQKLTGLLIAAVMMALMAFGAQAGDYSFKVHNTTKDAIKQILASEDGKKWGNFDIGAGIPAGESVTLVWDKSTDNQSCKQWFKAVYADGSEAEAVQFDFCEKGLELEF
jgi:hypothetical protein